MTETKIIHNSTVLQYYQYVSVLMCCHIFSLKRQKHRSKTLSHLLGIG